MSEENMLLLNQQIMQRGKFMLYSISNFQIIINLDKAASDHNDTICIS